jgi:hypothetical protein
MDLTSTSPRAEPAAWYGAGEQGLICGFWLHPEQVPEQLSSPELAAKLDELAKYLYEKETITGDEFMAILEEKDPSEN